MEIIGPYEANKGYCQPTSTPPPVTSNESSDFEGIGRLYMQNEQQRKRIEELERSLSEAEDYEQCYKEKCKKYDALEKENDELKEKIKQLEQQLEYGNPPPSFLYNYDITDFHEKMQATDIERLMDNFLELAETKLPRGYLMETAMDVVSLYILLAERNVFRKHDNSDNDTRNWGLTSFCDCWNNNVVPRITDENRKVQLCCDSKKIKSELSRDLWKNAASCSWSNLYDRCDNSKGQISKRKAKLGRAINIQRRLERHLEQIPALKSKKY